MRKDSKFTIRVYALIINNKNQVLVSDEYVFDMYMTKFPGGGLEFGEGTIDCVKRELLEECGQEIEVTDHFYTTDYFQPTVISDGFQVISIYYLAHFKEDVRFRITDKAFDFQNSETIAFRWLSLDDLTPALFTLPIDKKVSEMLKHKKQSIE